MKDRAPLRTAAAVVLMATSGAVAADDAESPWSFHIGANLASTHVNSTARDLEEFNYGAFVGATYDVTAELADWGVDLPGTEVGAEIGAFRDSKRETSAFLLWQVDTPLVTFNEDWQLRAGVFGGYARYARFADDVSLNIGDFIPVGGLQVAVRAYDRVELRAKVVPSLDDSDFVVGYQALVRF